LCIVGRAQVHLHLVDVNNGLPLVAVDGYASVFTASELLMELTVSEFIGAFD
jgi:hypothetical protein